jgi:N-acyl-D-amino-acid deacylase
MYDVLIKGGTIFDGTGKKDGFVADIGISGGLIKDIGNLKSSSATKIINAEGFFVSPGFIDILNHSDTYLTLFTIPKQNSLVSQGVTTIIGGSCGSSLAPLVFGEAIESVQKWTDVSQINIDWLRTSEFFDVLRKKDMLTLNFGTLTGYGTIRHGVLKDQNKKATPQEIEITRFLLDQSQNEGSFGVSSGLVYADEKNTSEDELKSALLSTVKHKNIFTVHLRNEADKLLDSLREVLFLAEETGAKLHISHLKVLGKDNWSKFDAVLDEIEKVQKRGVDLTFDVFPYASNGMSLYTVLRRWAREGTKKDILARLNDQKESKKIEKDLREMRLNYKKITIASLAGDKIFLGKTIDGISQNWGVTPERAIIDILLGSDLKVIVFAHVMSEENVQKAIKHPFSIVASDGAGYDLKYKKIGDMPHPRAFGAFSRFLRKYPNPNNQNIISYKNAIYKITGYPAERFGIKNRGYIKKNYFADITIFNPKTIEELTTFEYPYEYSVGVMNVFVNGSLIYENGKFFDGFYGKVLKKQ